MNPNKPEPAPKGTGREITPLVIRDLEIRSKMGKEKYGETLRAYNGRNPLVDLYQELMDAVQYVRQVIEEMGAITSRTELPPNTTARQFLAAQNEKIAAEAEQNSILIGQMFMDTAFPRKVVGEESIAQEAHRLVLGDRGEDYGHPIFDMTRTADMLTALLRNKMRPGARLEAEDIAQAMICVKQSRHRNKPKRDNNTDTAGYALTLEMMRDWRRDNPGVDPRDVFPD